jgi:hypothetical protein
MDSTAEILRRLRDDLLYAGERMYVIRPKDGPPKLIRWNKAQRYLHAKLEEQRARTGKVRAIILKGRQQGISTYVQARYFHRVTTSFGVQAFILTHEDKASGNLFGYTRRMFENMPGDLKPHADIESTSQLHFDALDSGYEVSTAGSRGTGRSFTIQLFHGSEVAFWRNDTEHESGVIQAIPEADGTESILESTAFGVGNVFHKRWQDAEAGLSDYQAIFIPWHWQEEYQSDVPAKFELTPDDEEYRELHGLTMRQMAWRAKKIADWHGDTQKFKQEYPANPQEAFEESGGESFIPSIGISRARKARGVEPVGARIGGIDVARYGDDRTVFTERQGRVIQPQIVHIKKSTMQVAGLAAAWIRERQLDHVFVDVIGLGAGVLDRLHELFADENGEEWIEGVNSAEKADEAEKYVNVRAEMNDKARLWLEQTPVSVPDDDAFAADATACSHLYDSNGRLQIERKDQVKKRGKRSPDCWDSAVLTFRHSVKRRVKKEAESAGIMPAPQGWMR